MYQTLSLHPDSSCAVVTRIDVEATRPRPGHLMLRYTLSGTIAGVRLPKLAPPARTDELWRHTCFEVFIRARDGTAYYECNLSPSTEWAAYRFTSYRSGMTLSDIGAPRIQLLENPDSYELTATIDLERLADVPKDGVWLLGISAVIEELSGSVSYWALRHPPGRADFHHSDCFALDLAPA